MKKLGLLSVIAAMLLIGFATTNCNKKPAKAPQLDTAGLHLGTTGSTTNGPKLGAMKITTMNSTYQSIGGVIVFLAGDLDSAKAGQVYTYGGVPLQDSSGKDGGTAATIVNVPIRVKPFYVGAYQRVSGLATKYATPHSFDVKTNYSSTQAYMNDTISVR